LLNVNGAVTERQVTVYPLAYLGVGSGRRQALNTLARSATISRSKAAMALSGGGA